MGIFWLRNTISEEEILSGKRFFAQLWNYCKPIITNVSTRLGDKNRLQALESFTYLNDECNKHFNRSLGEVVSVFLQVLERKVNEFSPGHFDVIDADCRTLGLENKAIFYPENDELQIFIISSETGGGPIMLQLVKDSPILSIYYSENCEEKSIAIDGGSV